jgi:trk system potassium uptake protein TrkH
VISTITTTGLANADYQLLGTWITGMALILALIGGCSGTPSGGIKIARVLYQAKSIALIFRGRRFARAGRLTISLSSLQYLQVFITFFFMLLFISVFVLTATGLDLTTSFSVSVMSLTNLGVGLGREAGWAGTFSQFNDVSKYWIVFLMVAGRLEMGLIFVFASARYWMSPETMGVAR